MGENNSNLFEPILTLPEEERTSRKRRHLWSAVAALSVFIYATLPVMRGFLRFLYRSLGREPLSLAVNILLIIAMLASTFYLFFRKQVRNPFDLTTITLIFLSTGIALTVIEIPEERIHFLEYGLLGALIFTAWSIDISGNLLYLASLVLIALLGGIDEIIQYFLPNRVGEFRDFVLNLVGGMIGMVVAWVLSRSPRKNSS